MRRGRIASSLLREVALVGAGLLLAVVRGEGVCGDAVEGAGCQDAAEKQGRKCCGGVVGGVEVQGKGGGYTQEEDAEEGQKGVADDAKVVQHSFCPLVACHAVDGGVCRPGGLHEW